jgi:hypothetical protein
MEIGGIVSPDSIALYSAASSKVSLASKLLEAF